LAEPREHRQLKTIERVTKNKITVQKVPTVADLHARRLEATRAALEDILISGDLGHVGVVVESLTDEYDVIEVAMAAVKLAHEAVAGPADEDEIPEAAASSEADSGRGKHKGKGKGAGNDRGKGASSARGDHKDRPRPSAGGTARVYVGAGRTGGVRPQDLVGAIAGETRLTGRDIGAIEITDRFSLVEVPSDSVDEVVGALRATRIKGQKVQVRPDRDAPSSSSSSSRPPARSSAKPGKSSPRPPAKSSGKAAPRPRGGR
jgi:ATP-dependent RNA helicase DeaD